MSVFVNSDFNPKQLSPQTLAFMGDTVYDLLVREYLINKANRPVGELNKRKVNYVKCEAQSKSADFIMSDLTETELSVYKRGRNAFTKNTPKNSDVADYHSATGLEALFGYLYLNGENDRIKELFSKCVEAVDTAT
ncbi:MAG: ribonuclease III [Ruminococcus sp.]|nr:ribonuclease III [Ruminococcus sp.]